jgi:tellurite resistance protein TehA-like permease
VIKGTGTVPIVLHALPYPGQWLNVISAIIFGLNTGLFLFAITCMISRFILFPNSWREVMAHPIQSLFLAAIPMALSTEIQAWVILCVPRWGATALWFGWIVWWINVALAVACALLLPFLM